MTTTTLEKKEVAFDAQKADAFANRLMDMMNGGALSIMGSIGHRVGLFDTMRALPPATSQEIADASGLNERYVREWLGAMTTGGIVECHINGNGDAPRYSLPAEHAAFLTRANPADNIGVLMQYIGQLGAVEDKVVDCFRNGGGVPYSEFSRFAEIMAEDSGQSVLPVLVDQILPLAPGVIDRLRQGIDVLDIGCGRGKALNLMAKTFPNSRFVGYDLLDHQIDYASNEAREQGNTNVRFEVHDLVELNEPKTYDLITAFDVIHDQARPDIVLRNVHTSLRDDGTFLMQDIAGSSHHHENHGHPIGPLLYTVSTMHCMTVSLAQGGMGLGTMWGEDTAQKMLHEAGFEVQSIERLPHDVQNCYYICTKK
ncbi:MAG: class I SAM-dependent methyltransferase [Candidatus Zixiibacteriota bacterium]